MKIKEKDMKIKKKNVLIAINIALGTITGIIAVKKSIDNKVLRSRVNYLETENKKLSEKNSSLNYHLGKKAAQVENTSNK